MSSPPKTYSQLAELLTFEERFNYLDLHGVVGRATFGFDRWLNQQFYTSRAWRDVRREVVLRDGGCDLGVPGYEIERQLLVHHMNPAAPEDFGNHHAIERLLDPEYLITTCHRTHNAIHFGDRSLLPQPPAVRRPGDTRLW